MIEKRVIEKNLPQLESFAFPNISTGVYGYPKEKAAEAAVRTVKETLPLTSGIKRIVYIVLIS